MVVRPVDGAKGKLEVTGWSEATKLIDEFGCLLLEIKREPPLGRRTTPID